MDWPATQGQQQHATSWPVEKIHHTWSYGGDATVLDDYALRGEEGDDEDRKPVSACVGKKVRKYSLCVCMSVYVCVCLNLPVCLSACDSWLFQRKRTRVRRSGSVVCCWTNVSRSLRKTKWKNWTSQRDRRSLMKPRRSVRTFVCSEMPQLLNKQSESWVDEKSHYNVVVLGCELTPVYCSRHVVSRRQMIDCRMSFWLTWLPVSSSVMSVYCRCEYPDFSYLRVSQ